MIVHLPTPHDHFSSRTGSAVMTVIDGLARGDHDPQRHRVLVAEGTYPDRYSSAEVIEYPPGPWVDGRRAKVDALAARAGLGRPFAHSSYQRAMAVVPEDEHVLLLHNAPFTGRLAPARSTPVLYAHNEILPGPRFAAARAIGGFAGIVAVSDWLAQQLSDRLPRSIQDRISVLLNGVDVEAHSASTRPERDQVNILFLGRVVAQKGTDLLLRACARLDRAGARVRVVGSAGFSADGSLTPYEEELRVLAAQARTPVEFRPFIQRDRVPDEYAWADVVVLPARWNDPCPLTLLEAMASGAAIVISDSGGMPQQAAGSAVIVPRDNVDALAQAIEALVDDPGERRRLGELARARAEDLDWSSRAAQLHDLLARWR